MSTRQSAPNLPYWIIRSRIRFRILSVRRVQFHSLQINNEKRARVRRFTLTQCRQIVQLARVGLPADQRPTANGLARAGHPVSYWVYLRLSFSRPIRGFFAVAAL